MPKRIFLLSVLLSGMFLAIAGCTIFIVAYNYDIRPGPLGENRLIRIKPGFGVTRIVSLLKHTGAINRPGLFVVSARVINLIEGGAFRAGEYLLPARVSPRGIRRILKEGKTYQRQITIVEGSGSQQAHAIIASIEELSGDPGPIPPEGSLLPETYLYSWGDQRRDVLTRMQRAMTSQVNHLLRTHPLPAPLKTPQEVITLASIIEKETGDASERPIIASVFLNRLRKNIALQSDPTVIYAITKGTGPLTRSLRRADLNIKNPYNTYRYPGLPPGPIANPGLASIKAVLRPDDTPYLYFVADGKGSHRFARTFSEHRKNIKKWRIYLRQKDRKLKP